MAGGKVDRIVTKRCYSRNDGYAEKASPGDWNLYVLSVSRINAKVVVSFSNQLERKLILLPLIRRHVDRYHYPCTISQETPTWTSLPPLDLQERLSLRLPHTTAGLSLPHTTRLRMLTNAQGSTQDIATHLHHD